MKNLCKIIFLSIIFTNPFFSSGQSLTWQRLYNGHSNYYDNGRGVCENKNGELYVTGYVLSGSAVVLKLKPNGDTIWTRNFGGFRGDFILPTSEGGCIITGQSSLVYTLKLDSVGNMVWLKTYPGSNQIITTDMIMTTDGGYLICGYQTGNELLPGYLIKIDSSGIMQWQKYFFAGNIKVFYSVAETSSGNFIVSGYKYECKFCNGYPLLLELNPSGDSLWERTYNLFADFKKVYADKNGFLIGGTIRDSPFVYINTFIMKTNLNGDITFRKNINYNNREDFKDMSIININKYVITCDTDTLNRRSAGVYVVDSSCNVMYRKIFYVTDYSLFFSVQPLRNGDIIFSGTVDTHLPQGRDIYVVRSDSMLFANPVGIKKTNNFLPREFTLLQNYPNPFNPTTNLEFGISDLGFVSLKVYDLLGKEVKTFVNEIKPPGMYNVVFDGSNLASGIYFYKLEAGSFASVKSMLLIK